MTRKIGRRHAYRVAFALVLAAVVLAVSALPFALISMVENLVHPVDADAFRIVAPVPQGAAPSTALNIQATSLDEVDRLLTLQITGDRRCIQNCGGGQIVRLFSLRANPQRADGTPPSKDVSVPPSGEVDTTVDLPVTGGLGAYPFDRYHLILGVALSDITARGQQVPVSTSAARDQLDVSVDEQIPRLGLASPSDLTGNYSQAGAPVALAAQLDFSRPFYLQALAVLIIVFITVAGLYSVTTRAFNEIIGTVGVIVLGVWGVRTLLVGSYPPDSTAIDLILTLVILLLLLILAVRGLAHVWRKGRHSEDAVMSDGVDGTGSMRRGLPVVATERSE